MVDNTLIYKTIADDSADFAQIKASCSLSGTGILEVCVDDT